MAILRAAYLSDPDLPQHGPALLLTYNKALCAYIRAIAAPELRNVTVEHYHKFARGYLASRGRMRRNDIIGNAARERVIAEAIAQTKCIHPSSALFNRPVNFFTSEVGWLEKHGVVALEDYEAQNRTGRAEARLERRFRKEMWDLYQAYLAVRKRAGYSYDWDDLGSAVLHELEADQSPRRYRHIVIDEGQDLAPEMIRSLAKALPTNGSITFFGDVAQQIYGHRMSWRSAGLASDGLVHGALDFDEEVLQKIGCFDKRISGAGTVAAAAAIFLGSKYAVSPFKGVVRAASARGADTDTIGSMTGALVGAINGADWLVNVRPRLQDHAFLAELAHDLEKSSHGYTQPSAPSDTDINVRHLVIALARGNRIVTLPTGAKADVLGDGGVVSKSDKISATSWKLRDEKGQTFFVKKLKKQPSAEDPGAQSNLELPPAKGPHAKFAGISLFARDLDESRHFYCDLLGLPAKRNSQTLVALGEHLVLRQNDLVRAVGEGSIVYVDVDDIDRCWKNLLELRYAQVSSIERRSKRPSFTCKDPDGRTVEVFQR